ncbi:MAG: cofactor-independent phosphoglycerate mutase [bacterium]
MKYVIMVGDGMSDRPIKELNGKTPLEVAKIPAMNEIVKAGMIGTVKTIPNGLKPGSDVANLAVLGYDPKVYYTGRGPLEAANMGVEIAKDEVAFRCNLVTVENDILADYSAGHITNKESSLLISFLKESMGSESIRFIHGKSYRHLVIFKTKSPDELDELVKTVTTPPHDIMGATLSNHLPKGRIAALLTDLMERSRMLLEKHEINKKRIVLKENPGNMIWLWGQGTNPSIPSFKGLFGVDGAVISAVDLVNGIGKLVGLEVINVPGATGYYDTNYQGKGDYAVKALDDKDFVFVHVEAPDEAGHNGDMLAKISAIESFDKYVVATVWNYLKASKDFRVMVLPDHATPISLRTHVTDPVPFAMAGSGVDHNGFDVYSETVAALSSIKFESGTSLTEAFFKR